MSNRVIQELFRVQVQEYGSFRLFPMAGEKPIPIALCGFF
jgi:hypothetical protein